MYISRYVQCMNGRPGMMFHGLGLRSPVHVGGMQVLLALFAFDDFTGFKVTQLLELPQPWSIIIVWGVVLPGVFLAASALTNLVLKDALILKVVP